MNTNPKIFAFNTVYEQNYKGVFRFVKSYVHSDATAEDIVSESLIKLWKNIKGQPVTNIKPLLFTIARNATLDYLKHEAVVKKSLDNIQKKSIEELNFRIPLLESYDPSDLFSTEIKQIFEKTLSELPPKTRQAFELSRLECKTYKEIAEIMEISVKGVDYHMTAALKKFRVTLKDYLPVLFFL